MIIYLKNKHTLEVDDFKFRCSIGKNGKSKKKEEGDKKTPIGYFEIENLYYRSDRIKKPSTKLKCIKIKKNMGWCDDPFNLRNYNKLIKLNKGIKFKKVIFDRSVSKVSIIGVGMITTPGVTFRMFQALSKKNINILAISTSEIKISVLINRKNIRKAVATLHKEFKLD